MTKHARLLRLEMATVERAVELSDGQIRLLERFSPEFRERHIETPHTGCLVAVEPYFVGTLKGVGKIHLQTAIDCPSRHVGARLYHNKLLAAAVYLVNNKALPAFEAASARLEVILFDNGCEFCGRPNRYPYELFLQLEAIEHRTTKVRRPESNGIVERLHRTLLDEHLRVEGGRTWFETIEQMQAVLDDHMAVYNHKRPQQGRGMSGRTPMTAFSDGLPNDGLPNKEKPNKMQKAV